MSSNLVQPITHKLKELNIKQTPRTLLVSIPRQELIIVENGRERRRFTVSTSARPASCIENSLGTPTGLHRIAQKLGEGAPVGEVFKGRISIGKRYWELTDGEQRPNLVTTRILWLEGLEPDHNRGPGRDSRDRYIYFHGTNHEDRIGQPASAGCILLRNQEMIELYNAVQEGDLVYISA